MILITKTVLDQNGRPVSAAQVTIRDGVGALVAIPGGNPRQTDGSGTWSAPLEVGIYALVITKGDASLSRTLIVSPMDAPRTIIAETVVVLVRAPSALNEAVLPIAISTRSIHAV